MLTGIFYAEGMNANALVFDKIEGRLPANRKPWVHDLGKAMRLTLVSNRLKRSDPGEFVLRFRPGHRHDRIPTWSPETPAGRWRSYDVSALLKRDKAVLDISWSSERCRTQTVGPEALDELTGQIIKALSLALEQMAELAAPRPAA